MGSDDIDIFDANLQPLGSMDWMDAHRGGQWHRTFHCWVFQVQGAQPRVLFQLRSPHGNFPDVLDVSAAGHLQAGEQVLEGIREVREELGIDIDAANLIYAGERVEVADQDNGQRNREYQSIYLYRTETPLSEFRPQVEEVWGLFWLPAAEGLDLFGGRIEQLTVQGICFDPATKRYAEVERSIQPGDFLPRIQRYYTAALICVERASEGKEDVAIS